MLRSLALIAAFPFVTAAVPYAPTAGFGRQAPHGPATLAVTAKADNCPALPSGTGILRDGDFSRADYPGSNVPTYSAGQHFAPKWVVTGKTIDFAGSYFKTPNGLCSVDLDGTPGPGGILHGGFRRRRVRNTPSLFCFPETVRADRG